MYPPKKSTNVHFQLVPRKFLDMYRSLQAASSKNNSKNRKLKNYKIMKSKKRN